MNAMDRFFRKVNKSESACWNWIGAIDIGGYGRFWFEGKEIPAHHFLVLAFKPKGSLVLHKCDNRACVNPEHTFFGTHKDNTRDMHQKGRANQRPGWEAMMRVRRIRVGESNHKSKLTEKQVVYILSKKMKFGDISNLARKYGVSHESIRKVVARKSWRHITAAENKTTIP